MSKRHTDATSGGSTPYRATKWGWRAMHERILSGEKVSNFHVEMTRLTKERFEGKRRPAPNDEYLWEEDWHAAFLDFADAFADFCADLFLSGHLPRLLTVEANATPGERGLKS